MTDVFTKEKRSEVMSRIQGKDTKPEVVFRKALFALGFRYRIHDRKLPGKPDIVLANARIVVFVHGCFWHGHEECPHYRPPKSNTGFWVDKIGANKARDHKAEERLRDDGWRVLIVWECALETVPSIKTAVDMAVEWIGTGVESQAEIRADRVTRSPRIEGYGEAQH